MGVKYHLLTSVKQLDVKKTIWSKTCAAAIATIIILSACLVVALKASSRSQTPLDASGCQQLAADFETTAVLKGLQDHSLTAATQYNSSAPQKLHIVTVIGKDTPFRKMKESSLLRSLPPAMRKRVWVLQANSHIGHGLKIFGAFGGKITELHKFVTSPQVAPTDLVLFTDGLDVVIDAKALEDVPAKFAAIVNNRSDSDAAGPASASKGPSQASGNPQRLAVVFSAEQACWPDGIKSTCYPHPASTPYHYLNSGGFIGHAAYLKALLQPSMKHVNRWTDDQRFYTNAYLALQEDNGFFLDRDCSIFQTMFNVKVAPDGDLVFNDSMRAWYNRKTKTFPVLLHGNGNTKKVFFDQVVPKMSDSWSWNHRP